MLDRPPGEITFRRAVVSKDKDALVAFDRAVFGTDAFAPECWDEYEAYWMMVGGERAGCCAFERGADFKDDDNSKLAGSVYIVSTAILPKYQGKGLGERFKRWQIAWARRNRFRQMVTNSRQSNHRMIGLNRKLGFEVMWVTKRNYYDRPAEKAVAMKLVLPRRSRSAAPSRVARIVAQLVAERNRLDRAIDALTTR